MKYRIIKFYGGLPVGSIIEPTQGVAEALLHRKRIEPVTEDDKTKSIDQPPLDKAMKRAQVKTK